MVELRTEEPGNVLVCESSGLLTGEDFEVVMAEIGRLAKHEASVRLLVVLNSRMVWDVDGVASFLKILKAEPGAVTKMALVGDEATAILVGQMVAAYRDYPIIPFPETQFDKALHWLRQD